MGIHTTHGGGFLPTAGVFPNGSERQRPPRHLQWTSGVADNGGIAEQTKGPPCLLWSSSGGFLSIMLTFPRNGIRKTLTYHHHQQQLPVG
ncbi:hypothetical protein ZHAS_00000724 [Anopheles sinensis]|uniref:Uncharacterized protein n=1 Tax=Anopheles sinensis TaxID=74873 RepID=A0A084VAH2_ANOSI|nr:hypothetical protein ZHAS_00000724 [Anopheles sinensis]